MRAFFAYLLLLLPALAFGAEVVLTVQRVNDREVSQIRETYFESQPVVEWLSDTHLNVRVLKETDFMYWIDSKGASIKSENGKLVLCYQIQLTHYHGPPITTALPTIPTLLSFDVTGLQKRDYEIRVSTCP